MPIRWKGCTEMWSEEDEIRDCNYFWIMISSLDYPRALQNWRSLNSHSAAISIWHKTWVSVNVKKEKPPLTRRTLGQWGPKLAQQKAQSSLSQGHLTGKDSCQAVIYHRGGDSSQSEKPPFCWGRLSSMKMGKRKPPLARASDQWGTTERR